MPRLFTAINKFLGADQKDTLPVNHYRGFKENGAIVLRDRRGTRKAEVPDVDLKAETLSDDPLAIVSARRSGRAIGKTDVCKRPGFPFAGEALYPNRHARRRKHRAHPQELDESAPRQRECAQDGPCRPKA
jgi:hypothetical protein